MEDVVVIGAGLSGLTAARGLHQAGYRVLVVDKSRGLGGRLATRRTESTVIDHGCRYLQPFADSSLSPIPSLLSSGVLQPWQPESFELTADGTLRPTTTGPLYVAPQGMSAIAKALSPGLTIHRQWRATALTPIPQGWEIVGESLDDENQAQTNVFAARAVVVAIPAPQALELIAIAAAQSDALGNLGQQLQTVEFEAVITIMAGYGPTKFPGLSVQQAPGSWMVTGKAHPTLQWVGLDSGKRTDSKEPVVVVHSSAAFGANHINHIDLKVVGQALLAATAANLDPWLSTPDWMQVHRWRYGFVRLPLGSPILTSSALPTLTGCGDWCNGEDAEGAIASGRQAAEYIGKALE